MKKFRKHFLKAVGQTWQKYESWTQWWVLNLRSTSCLVENGQEQALFAGITEENLEGQWQFCHLL